MVKYPEKVYNGKIDPLNFEHLRNGDNVKQAFYNCGGFALGTYSWYCPYPKRGALPFGYGIFHETMEKMAAVTELAVNAMVEEFLGKLRRISSLDEVSEGEYAVAFRISDDGDFHYVRCMPSGEWLHKPGTSYIRSMTFEDVFAEKWSNRYNGPVVLLAMREN